MHDDEAEARRDAERNRGEGAPGIGGRHEDEPSEQRRRTRCRRATSRRRVLALERRAEELQAVLLAEKEAGGERARGGRGRRRAEPARKRAGPSRETARFRPGVRPSAAAELREDRGRGDRGRVAARGSRGSRPPSPEIETTLTPGVAREPGGERVARPVQRGAEDVEADPEVRDGRGSEDGDRGKRSRSATRLDASASGSNDPMQGPHGLVTILPVDRET